MGRYAKQSWQSGSVLAPYGPINGARLQHIEDAMDTIYNDHDGHVASADPHTQYLLEPAAPGSGQVVYFNGTAYAAKKITTSEIDPAAGILKSQLASLAIVDADVNAISSSKITGLSASSSSGLLSALPSAASRSNAFYYATDQAVLYFSDGATWTRVGAPAGATTLWFSSTTPTGFVSFDGSNLPGSTGIYAALYAHLGNSLVTPDTRGRMPVMLGTHADVDVIGDSDGLAVGSRRPKHKHTVNDPSHTHNPPNPPGNSISGVHYASASGSGTNISDILPFATTGITIGPQTGSEPTDSAGYIACRMIAKL